MTPSCSHLGATSLKMLVHSAKQTMSLSQAWQPPFVHKPNYKMTKITNIGILSLNSECNMYQITFSPHFLQKKTNQKHTYKVGTEFIDNFSDSGTVIVEGLALNDSNQIP